MSFFLGFGNPSGITPEVTSFQRIILMIIYFYEFGWTSFRGFQKNFPKNLYEEKEITNYTVVQKKRANFGGL